MTLIRCDSDCFYQKDGYCTNDSEAYENSTMNLDFDEGCIYYKKSNENETICCR